jgi:hypothetical protein
LQAETSQQQRNIEPGALTALSSRQHLHEDKPSAIRRLLTISKLNAE